MLQRQNNDLPLLLSSSSAPMECNRIENPLIIRPQPMAVEGDLTFDWSHFPVVQRDRMMLSSSSSSLVSGSVAAPLHEQLVGMELSSCVSDSDFSTTSTSSFKSSKSSKHSRRVSFDQNMHVRTHSVVLGEHPCCSQLALELGWEHDGDGQIIDLNSYESSKKPQRSCHRRIEARRRSYFERKRILKEVTGMTDAEIRKTTLRHAAPSSRDLASMQRGVYL